MVEISRYEGGDLKKPLSLTNLIIQLFYRAHDIFLPILHGFTIFFPSNFYFLRVFLRGKAFQQTSKYTKKFAKFNFEFRKIDENMW